MISNQDIFDIVKIKIGNQLEVADSYLACLIDEMGQEIKNYCNIKTIPDALKYVWANMVTDYSLRFSPEAIAAAKAGDAESDGGETISSVSLGGISASLGTSDASSMIKDANKIATKGIAEFVKDYKSRLQPFRRVRW